MHEIIEPNAWVALKLPSENVRVIRIVPDTYVDLRSDCNY